ncbi:hypothetical protein [Cytophaga sp. FL35]|uniref:type II secretion system protein GspD n=1 Tax=Cytophaga sp. FL35 TaxID=1904456 RepID=UPI001CA38BD2|nr:hypothetical protein [Cytophaga sp. FL35]
MEVLALDNSELNENLKLEINVNNVNLSNFLIAVSRVHNLNITVAPSVGNINIINNFSDVTVADLLVYLCKEYDLTIDFTGNILSIKKYSPPIEIPKEKEILISYSPSTKLISLDLENDALDKVFRKIIETSGSNLLYSNSIGQKSLNLYVKDVPFTNAMHMLAEMNGLHLTQSKEGFYLFDVLAGTNQKNTKSRRHFGKNHEYIVLDTVNKLLTVDFKDKNIATIIQEISLDLNLDVYMATPLEEAGSVTFNAKEITFDDLLLHIFESKEAQGFVDISNSNNARPPNRPQDPTTASSPTSFSFKKEGNIYFFGTSEQLSVRNTEIVQMMHRSVELLGDPSVPQGSNRTSGRTSNSNINYYGNSNSGQNSFGNTNNLSNRRSVNTTGNGFENYNNTAEAIINIIPNEIKSNLDIRVDYELNSFFVSGPSANINRFKSFINEIDKPVPVVLIEVMIIEVKKSATVETGISWGIGDEPTTTQGKLFPESDINLGANTVNKIIGGFDGFGSFNVGQIVPEFFANIKAMEENGNLKIRSTPKLSTLNGHRANLSIGETTYYVVTNQNYFGSQIPTTSEIRNYEPIDAELAISIKPLVSGNGQVTLDINVIQSDFSGDRIEEDAPPGLTSREFSSIIRMQNQDLAILGGLEEKLKNDTGNGVPVLARIPVIKWLFSKRKREDTKQKLTILIKPTVIY